MPNLKKIKILFDYSPLCREAKTGIPIFVEKLYEELSKIDTIQIEKTFCFCKYLPTKPWRIYRFFEQVLYHNLYLPFKLKWGKYDVYVENQYMFIPFFKPKHTTIVTVLYDIALQLLDNIQSPKHTKNWRKKLPISIKNTDILLTISQSSKKDIEHYLTTIDAKNPVEYIYIDVDIVETEQINDKDVLHSHAIDQPYFLFLGTLEPRKNPLKLIEAFHMFKTTSGSKMKLVFAGKKGWLYDDVMQYITTHHLENEVIFTGYISDEEKVSLLRQTSAFVFLSIYEGFGIPALEALKLGTPTLVSDIDVFHELFNDNVLYADPHDSADIANKMNEILINYPDIDETIFQKFSWEISAHKFVDILNQNR